MRFHLYPLSRAFSNRCVFDENAQRFSVDRRPKRIEMYAFSNENALVWTGPKSPLLLILQVAGWKNTKYFVVALCTKKALHAAWFNF